MNRAAISVTLLLLIASSSKAEVRTEEKNQVKFEGMMGRMMGMFGGKAAREGVVNTVAVKGNRKMTVNDTTGTIVDLDEQKVYELDMRKKSYEVVTFEEMRRRMQEAQEKAAKATKEEPKQEQQQGGKQMEVEFSLKESGQKKDINGFDCREVVMTITSHEKGKPIEQAGGMVMTSHIWLGPEIPATKEIAEFDKRYWEALRGPVAFGGDMQQMAMMSAMYPAMKEMMSKMQAENVNMQGTPILTETVTETVLGTEQAAAQEQKQEARQADSGGITSIRGIGGMLGRKMARKKEDESAADKPKNRSTVFTANHELIKVSTSVSAADLSIPAGFKEKK